MTRRVLQYFCCCDLRLTRDGTFDLLQSFFMLGHDLCMATATHHLIEHQLKGTSLRGLVFTRRRAGVSWQAIANEVRDLTGVIVSRETLRNWYPDAPAPQTAASA